MKQHAVPVTEEKVRAILKEELSNYPTKDEFSKRLDASFEAFRQENAYQFQLMREDLHKDLSTFTNRILTVIDPLIREMETRQQDRELTTAQIKDLNRRVTRLERHDV